MPRILKLRYKILSKRCEEMSDSEKKYKRRVRYSGTHPRNYNEKYKEHQPDKYSETVEKVIGKGSTPAGMHISICVNEILDILQINITIFVFIFLIFHLYKLLLRPYVCSKEKFLCPG